MATQKAITQGLFLLSEILDMKEITKTTIKVWSIGLRSYSDSEVGFAFDYLIEHICSGDVRYTKDKVLPGDLVEIIDKTINLGWSNAWEECLHNFHRVNSTEFWGGKYHEFNWSSDQIEKSFERFGGKSAFSALPKDPSTNRAQFREIYKEVAEEKRKAEKIRKSGMQVSNGTIEARPDPVNILMSAFENKTLKG